MVLAASVITAISEGSWKPDYPYMLASDLHEMISATGPRFGLSAVLTLQNVSDVFNRRWGLIPYRERVAGPGRSAAWRLYSTLDVFQTCVFLGLREYGVSVETAKAVVEFALDKWLPVNGVMADDVLKLEPDAPVRPRDLVAVRIEDGEIVSFGSDDMAELLRRVRLSPLLLFDLAQVLAWSTFYTWRLWLKRTEEVLEHLKKRNRWQTRSAGEAELDPGIHLLFKPVRLVFAAVDEDGRPRQVVFHVTAELIGEVGSGIARTIAYGSGPADAPEPIDAGLHVLGGGDDPIRLVAIADLGTKDRPRIEVTLPMEKAIELLTALTQAVGGDKLVTDEFQPDSLSVVNMRG